VTSLLEKNTLQRQNLIYCVLAKTSAVSTFYNAIRGHGWKKPGLLSRRKYFVRDSA